MAFTGFIAFLTVFCGLLLTLHRYLYESQPPYPPGPSKRPLFGNLLEMPSQYEYLRFREWSKIHGPIIHLTIPGRHLLILHQLEVAQDLLDRRALIYSDRPHLTMLSDVIGWDWSVALFNYGKRFLKYRRLLRKGLNGDMCNYQRIHKQETLKLLLKIQLHSHKFLGYLEHWAKAIILRATYGYDPEPEGDRYIWLAERSVEAITKTTQPGAYMVETFPALRMLPKWFPFMKFQHEAAAWSLLVQEVLESPMAYVKRNIAAGIGEPNYVANLLTADAGKHLGDDYEEQAIKETAATIHTAGADSVYSMVQSFILAILLHPQVQAKAQVEIDAVLGPHRLPDFSDRPKLPYVDHIVSETLRWARTVPLGVAHRLRSDDIYRGMFLPAGSIVMVNVWSISRDEELYDNPEVFRPERFEKHGVQDPRAYVFGFGRRVCAGRNHAESAIWICIASILATMHISKAFDDDGSELVPLVEYTSGLICKPKPFPCDIRPRLDRLAPRLL